MSIDTHSVLSLVVRSLLNEVLYAAVDTYKFFVKEVRHRVIRKINVAAHHKGVISALDVNDRGVTHASGTSVTVICVPLGNACSRTHFPSDICSPKQISLPYLATLTSVIYVSQG